MSSNITKNFKAKSALRKEHGGDVKGPGGPTEDKVGPVMLSDGEYVLPADTVAAVGVDNLDALRDATHAFENTGGGGRPKIPGRLRGMATGGVFYVDPEGNAARAPQPGRAMVPAKSQLPATQTAPPRAAPAAEPLRAQVLSSTPPDPSRMSQLRQAANTGGGRVGGFLRGAAPVQMTAGALGTLGDIDSGYRNEYNKQLGIAPDAGVGAQVAGDTARVMENVGDSLTFGLAGKLGRGIASALEGGSFSEGWSSPSERDRFAASQTPAAPTAAAAPQSATPVADALGPSAMANESNRRSGGAVDGRFPGALENRSGLANSDRRINGSTSAAYDAMGDNDVVGSVNGRNITKKEADARAAGLQTASFMPQRAQGDPLMDEIRSALRGIGGSRGGGAVISGQGGVDDINKRYDDLLRGGAGRNVVKGSDWSQRHGLSVEKERAKELSDYAQNQSTLRGQDNAAAIAADSNRTQLANTLINMQTQREKALADGNSAAGRAAADAAKAAVDADEKGLTDIREAVRARFGEDSALAESTLSRILSAGEGQISRVTSLTGQDRAAAIEDLLDSASAAQSFDDQQSSLWGNTDSGLPRATETRDPRFFRDVFAGGNRALPALGRELKELAGLDGRVMVDDNGRAAPLSDDLRQRRTQRRAEEDAPRRSRLRNDN